MKHRGRKSAAELAVGAAEPSAPRLVASSPYPEPPPPPRDLEKPERELWTKVASDYRGMLTSFAVLEIGLYAHKQMRDAQKQIAVEGMLVPNRDGNPTLNPAVKVERNARRDFLAIFKQLGIKL